MIICVFFNKLSNRIGIPVLLIFMLLGMLFGSDGILKISFNDFEFAEKVCSIALIFIIFYGGFGTKWTKARPVAIKAILLSSIGTILTAVFVGFFCFIVLHIEPLESLLIGAVLCSTDAASVFSILRSKRLNLKYNTASLLELESGSNDPFSYMLTMMVLSLMYGSKLDGSFLVMFLLQIIVGVCIGFIIAWLTVFSLKRLQLTSSGFHAIFITGICLLCYSISTLLQGNGYLSVYIAGIILGNVHMKAKQELVHFFDGVTGLAQMLLFFLLGLLSFPSQFPQIAWTAFAIALFMTFVARPIAVFLILAPFKSKWSQQLVVSWCGLRGAASIVFAIMTVNHPVSTNHDIFHIVFFIVLYSIFLQGALLPLVSKKLHMTDDEDDVLQTFTDFVDHSPLQCIQMSIPKDHSWINHKIRDIAFPPGTLVALVIRNEQQMIPNGDTVICAHDYLILCGSTYQQSNQDLQLYEKKITTSDPWLGKTVMDIKHNCPLILFIKRDETCIVPDGTTILKEHDILVQMEDN